MTQIIQRSILSGNYPAGQRLNEVEISESLGISRSPIREGLRKLADEGLVVLRPGRGAFVVNFALDELRELLEFREALDVMGARLAAQRATLRDGRDQSQPGSRDRGTQGRRPGPIVVIGFSHPDS